MSANAYNRNERNCLIIEKPNCNRFGSLHRQCQIPNLNVKIPSAKSNEIETCLLHKHLHGLIGVSHQNAVGHEWQ